MGKLDRKKVFNNSHNTRAIGCQMKLQDVITLQNPFPEDIKIYKGSEIKWITGIVREVLLGASPALKHFPRHCPSIPINRIQVWKSG